MYLILKTNVATLKTDVLNSAQDLKFALKFLKDAALEFVCDENGKKHAEHCIKAPHVTDAEITTDGYFLRFANSGELVPSTQDSSIPVPPVPETEDSKYNAYKRETRLGYIMNAYNITHEYVFQLTHVNSEAIGLPAAAKVTSNKSNTGLKTNAHIELITELQKVLDEKKKKFDEDTSGESLQMRIERSLSLSKDKQLSNDEITRIRIRTQATGTEEDSDCESDDSDEETESETDDSDEETDTDESSDDDSDEETDTDESSDDEILCNRVPAAASVVAEPIATTQYSSLTLDQLSMDGIYNQYTGPRASINYYSD